jgi:hypothetical protein
MEGISENKDKKPEISQSYLDWEGFAPIFSSDQL